MNWLRSLRWCLPKTLEREQLTKDKTVADAATKAVADYLLKAEEALVAAIALKTDYARPTTTWQ